MKRGRKPIGRKAMTAAARQARHRAKLRKIAQEARRNHAMWRLLAKLMQASFR